MVDYTVSWSMPFTANYVILDYRRQQPDGSFGEWVLVDGNIPDSRTSYTVRLPQGTYEFRIQANVGPAGSEETVTILATILGKLNFGRIRVNFWDMKVGTADRKAIIARAKPSLF